MDLPIIIIGAGGHARVLHTCLKQTGREITGVLAPGKNNPAGRETMTILGKDEMINKFDPAEVRLANGIGSVDRPLKRAEIFRKFKGKGFSFASVIHPSATICDETSFGEGTQIMAGAIIQAGAEIGKNVLINTGAVVEHDCRIGDHVHLATGAVLCGGVNIGEGCHIGAGSTIKQGTTIGKGAIIGAGSVVIRDVPANTTAAGVPARELQS